MDTFFRWGPSFSHYKSISGVDFVRFLNLDSEINAGELNSSSTCRSKVLSVKTMQIAFKP